VFVVLICVFFVSAVSLTALGGQYSEKTDVWMLGCVLVECLTAMEPFPGISNTDAAMSVMEGRATPAVPDDASEIFQQIGDRCFEFDPADRPSFSKLVDSLQ
jgi:mitogen-activated protein kinase kinase kinase